MIVKYPYGEKSTAARPKRAQVFAEVYPSQVSAADADWQMIVSDGYKLLLKGRDEALLFDLSSDPTEQSNLAALGYLE